nr:hypothetical protein [Candidatus Dadabacteria bacterium]
LKKNKYSLHLYNSGRLISYLSLGVLGGFLGSKFLDFNYSYISLAATVIISTFYMFFGYQLLVHKTLHLNLVKFFNFNYFKIANSISGKNKYAKSLTIGIINGLIPCGWVYIFLMGAISTKNIVLGATIMFFFWVGTLPALNFFPLIINRINNKMPNRYVAIAGVIIIMIGLSNILIHNYTFINHSTSVYPELCIHK